jgi:hypothetical protein
MQVNLFMRRQKSFDRLALMRREIIGNDMDLLAARLIGHKVSEEGDEFGEVWRVAVLPKTSPVLVLNAAYNESVPWR